MKRSGFRQAFSDADLVASCSSRLGGLGSRIGTWMLGRGFTPRHGFLGTWREGCGCLWEQYPNKVLDPAGIINDVPVPQG